MSRDLNHAMEYSSKWIEIINKKTVPEEEGKWIIDESKIMQRMDDVFHGPYLR